MALIADDLKPTVEEVSLLLRTRTVGSESYVPGGGVGGDTGPTDVTVFNENTRPSAAEVQSLIDTAYGAVYARLNADLPGIPDTQAQSIRHAVALYTCVLIEVSFFRETFNDAMIRLWRDEVAETLGGVNVAIGGSQRRPTFGSLTVLAAAPALPVPRMDPVPGIDD
jgi:hypothetical protein